MFAPQLTHAQSDWLTLGYGMFIHFGANTFAGKAWGDGSFPLDEFNPRVVDTDQWAEVAAEAGMRYAVLTTKHHDGFCLWPTRYTDYSVKNTPYGRDVVGAFVESCRRVGIRPGLYYSLWDRNFPDYEDDPVYAAFMRNQITELLTAYGDIVELWFDGAWDKDHPTRAWPYDPAWVADLQSGLGYGERWEWTALYDLIHALQPDCIVLNNSGSDRPGQVRYPPVDARTSEHFNFIWQGRRVTPITDMVFHHGQDTTIALPLEFCTSLNPNWFWLENEYYSHPSAAAIADWLTTARAANANLLLNVGPNRDGVIPDYHRPFLREAATRNAENVYNRG
jgi:alpha-L-fucosidase